MLAYLCGSVEFAGGAETLWQRKLAPFLRDQLGHRVYDPSEEAKRVLTPDEMANFDSWQRTDLERFRRVMRKIIASRLDLIEHKADYVVSYWETAGSHGGGTPSELTLAFRKGIPVYLVTQLPVEEIDAWALGCSDQVFSSLESLKEFLAGRFSREKQAQLWRD
jgi:hypothetical protein